MFSVDPKLSSLLQLKLSWIVGSFLTSGREELVCFFVLDMGHAIDITAHLGVESSWQFAGCLSSVCFLLTLHVIHS